MIYREVHNHYNARHLNLHVQLNSKCKQANKFAIQILIDNDYYVNVHLGL